MNRRDYLKYTGLTSLVALGTFGLYKYKTDQIPFDEKVFLGQSSMLAEIVDVIIPDTDSPGAKVAGVHLYILKVMLECEGEKEKTRFFNGLLAINERAEDNFGRAFIHCAKNQKEALIAELSSTHNYSYKLYNKVVAKLLGKPFFVRLREITVEGYCLSEAGATKGLVYDYIPGNYMACISLNKNQHSWATK